MCRPGHAEYPRPGSLRPIVRSVHGATNPGLAVSGTTEAGDAAFRGWAHDSGYRARLEFSPMGKTFDPA